MDGTRVVVDLTSKDGLKPGMTVSIRQESSPLVHPVTGEFLGALDEELATAKVVELREKFSGGEIQGVMRTAWYPSFDARAGLLAPDVAG